MKSEFDAGRFGYGACYTGSDAFHLIIYLISRPVLSAFTPSIHELLLLCHPQPHPLRSTQSGECIRDSVQSLYFLLADTLRNGGLLGHLGRRRAFQSVEEVGVVPTCAFPIGVPSCVRICWSSSRGQSHRRANADSYAMCRPAVKQPDEAQSFHPARDWRDDVLRCVAQRHREDLGVSGRRK